MTGRRIGLLGQYFLLVVRQEADRLVLEKPEQIKQRLKARFAQVPSERRLVEELIAERREESRQEGVR
jgi:hypothetical protein